MANEIIEEGDILIDKGKIVAVGRSLEAEGEIIDARDW